MNNFMIYPFQKNNYFYGKLLTVRDFVLEQKYINEKRQLVNRLIHGSGIVSGLKVTLVDDQTINIEPGLAIDNLGREIVVPTPITQKLAFIDGFRSNNYNKNVYLCLSYKEVGKERVHAVSSSVEEEEAFSEYNRIEEEYNITIKEEIEESYIFKNIDSSYKIMSLYEDDDVSLKLKHPAVVNPGEVFSAILLIEKKKKDITVEFDGILKADGAYSIKSMSSPLIEISFREPLGEENLNYSSKFLMTAGYEATNEGKLTIKREDFKLRVDNLSREIPRDVESDYEIVRENKKENLIKAYKNTTIEKRIDNDAFDYIYLAKIEVIKAGETYVIKRVIPGPFNQYIYNNNQLKNLSLMGENNAEFNITTEVQTNIIDANRDPNVNVNYDTTRNKFNFNFEIPKNQMIFENIVTGTVEIHIEESFKFGKNFLSDEISHGLGKGPVFVHVGVEENNLEKEEERIFYGEPQVFYKTEIQPDENVYSSGAVVYPKKGTFRVGIRLQSSRGEKTIKLRWWAYRNLADIDQKEVVKVIIEPSEVTLDRGEKFQFAGTVFGDIGDELIWKVEDEFGGTIDESGLYTAPSTDGVYKIRARSRNDESRSAEAFVTVSKKKPLLQKLTELKK